MVANTDNILQQVIIENPGLPVNKESYVFCNNKIPTHKGLKALNNKPCTNFNSIAINTKDNNYLCLDFDGYSTSNDDTVKKQEKQVTAERIKNNFIKLINKQTKKYRLDKTASNKYHLWLKHPDVPNKEFLKLPKFLTSAFSIIIDKSFI